MHLADIFDNVDIPALNITVPAIRLKNEKTTYYVFAIQPESLLKISYIAHRARGKKADLQAYQRIVDKSRVAEMKKYIDKSGMFPTNIVINLKEKPFFQEGKNQVAEDQCGEMGVLKLKNVYKSAWIIDGQHRLYAYSGHAKTNGSLLSVTAFEDLSTDMQAEFFIDINSKQKNVKQAQLQQLFGKVHKDAINPSDRIKSLIAQTIVLLNDKKESAFYQRVQNTEDKKNPKKCLSWNMMFNCISDSTFTSPEHGILWVKENDEATKERITYVVNGWFTEVKKEVSDWWDAGATKGSGGLAMNDSITACFRVLKSVLQHLTTQQQFLASLSNQELRKLFLPYAAVVSKYLASLSKEERQAFRDSGRGIQGQTQRARTLEIAIHKEISGFLPSTLKDYIQERKSEKTRSLLIEIKDILRNFIVEELQNEYGTEYWWIDEIPVSTQQRIRQEVKKDKEKQVGREQYLDFGDYKNIIQEHWNLFKGSLGYGSSPDDADSTSSDYTESSVDWLQKLNEMQEIIKQNKQVTPEQLDELDRYDDWLRKRITQTQEILAP